MYIHIYIHTHIQTSAHAYAHTFLHTFTFTGRLNTHTHTYTHAITHIIKGNKNHTKTNPGLRHTGATRAFGPGHTEIPEKYREIGQPVLIGGSMGTCSYVLTGTEGAMQQTFGSTCHGAGRAMSRSQGLKRCIYDIYIYICMYV